MTAVGDRVLTREGLPGVVVASAGDDTFEVVLDGGLGGGSWSSDELHAPRLASDSYPELTEILVERPPPAHTAARKVAIDGEPTNLDEALPIAEALGRQTRSEGNPLDWFSPHEVFEECGGYSLDEYVESEGGQNGEITSDLYQAYTRGYDGTTATVHTAKPGGPIDRLLNRTFEHINEKLPADIKYNPGHNASYDWCRFRHNERCMFPKDLNVDATKAAGYNVWIPFDRGYCWRSSWPDQRACPVSEPGPHSGDPNALVDATVPWDQGGQRSSGPPVVFGDTDLAGWKDEYAKTSTLDHDPDFAFHFVASWTDVRAKAKRIRATGGVDITAVPTDGLYITAHVRGTHGVYETRIMRVPGGRSVATWECGCKWATYSWGRSGRWKRFEGRMCSHALALVYEAQAREMFGGQLRENEGRPSWPTTRARPSNDVVRPDNTKPNRRQLPFAAGLTVVGVRGLGDDIPPEPGTSPIPAGTIRLYHYTREEGQVDQIAQQGILQSKAQGASYGEPGMVWGSAQVPDVHNKEFVEFYARDDDLDIGRGSRYDTVTMLGDVPPSHIVAVHKPWHAAYRYLEDSDINKEWLRNGTTKPGEYGDPDADKAAAVWMRNNHITVQSSYVAPLAHFVDADPIEISPAVLVARGLMEDGYDLTQVQARIASFCPEPRVVVLAALDLPFAVRYRGDIRTVLDVGDAFVTLDDGHPALFGEIQYPTFDPVAGLLPPGVSVAGSINEGQGEGGEACPNCGFTGPHDVDYGGDGYDTSCGRCGYQWYGQHPHLGALTDPDRGARVRPSILGAAPPVQVVAQANHSGAMVAIAPPRSICEALALDGGEAVEDMHITLAFLGEASDLREDALVGAVRDFASTAEPLTGMIAGYGTFTNNGDGAVLYASADIPGLDEWRHALRVALANHGVALIDNHGFTPHLTVEYRDEPGDLPSLPQEATAPFAVTEVILAYGGSWERYPITMRVTAAGEHEGYPTVTVTYTDYDTNEEKTITGIEMSREAHRRFIAPVNPEGGFSPPVVVFTDRIISESTLHDEPEPALPSTDGDSEADVEKLREGLAWLRDDTPPDDGDIAKAASAYLTKVASKNFSPAEQRALIDEGSDGARASNLASLDIVGTHYESLEAAFEAEEASESLWI